MAKRTVKSKVSGKESVATDDPEQNTSTAESNPPPSQSAGNPIKAPVKTEFDIGKMYQTIVKSLLPEPQPDADKLRDELIHNYLANQIQESPVAGLYNILILHDEGRMVRSDADNIYSAAAAFKERKPILLVLYSSGGVIGSAYLIGKLCREYSEERFVVVVPRQAKSAATLICCAADEIHMGSMSELGPIDPQIDQLPALGLKASVEHIADMVKDCPYSADMFAKYLNLSLKPIHLGYFERVAESAAQYAERLLRLHAKNLKKEPARIAKELVYSYKDHAFVIDKAEATEIFGEDVIRANTDEYRLGNSLYDALTLISRISDLMEYYFYFIGSLDSNPKFSKREKS